MIQNQAINYLLTTKDSSLITSNNIDESYFSEYRDEFNFIKQHLELYGNIPDRETFISKFNNFDLVEVREQSKYIINGLIEERNQHYLASTFNQIRKDLMDNKTEDAIETFKKSYNNITKTVSVTSTNLLADTANRYNYFIDVQSDWKKHYISTGFKELNDIFYGWNRFNDFVIVAARPGIGKSWILLKMALSAAEQGLNVGLYSGEMNSIAVGQRLDTLISNISLNSIMKGQVEVQNKYKEHLDKLKEIPGQLKVITRNDIVGSVTVSAIRSFIEQEKIDIMFIDQISLMDDELKARTFFEATANISKGLKALQSTLQIPIIAASQQNRNKPEAGTPDTSNIALSDRLSQDASIVLFLTQEKPVLNINVVKSRNSGVGSKISYLCDFNRGTFDYIPEEEQQDEKEELSIQKPTFSLFG